MIDSLAIAKSGLAAAKTAVTNLSNNIANADTPGYKKRVISLSEISYRSPDNIGGGVQIQGIDRITSEYMRNGLIDRTSKTSYYTELSQKLEATENILKEADNSGFSKSLNGYFESLESLRMNPTSEIFKDQLLTNGDVLVKNLKSNYQQIESLQESIENDLDQSVTKVNDILNSIKRINIQMSKSTEDTNSLLDKRDNLERELSELVDISVTKEYDNYELKIGDSIAIHRTNARDIATLTEKEKQIDKFTVVGKEDTGRETARDALKYTVDSENQSFKERVYEIGDVVSIKINDTYEIKATIGEAILDANGDPVDINNGKEPINIITKDNLTRAMVYKVNHDTKASEVVSAYNGNYYSDENGDIKTSDDKDNFLRLDSKVEGIEGKFEAKINVQHPDYKDSLKFQKNSETGAVEERTYEDGDKVEVKIGDKVVTVTIGEEVDFNDVPGDTEVDNKIVTRDNITEALTHKIRQSDANGLIEGVYSGDYKIDPLTGDKIEVDDTEGEKYLNIELKNNNTDVEIRIIKKPDEPAEGEDPVLKDPIIIGNPKLTEKIENNAIYKNEYQSKEASTNTYLTAHNNKINLNHGSIKTDLENISSDSPENYLQKYLDTLDAFARSMSDVAEGFMKDNEGNYTYGENASKDSVENYKNEYVKINLFEGSDVKSLKFNSSSVNEFNEEKLNYLATLQWKKDISFKEGSQNSEDENAVSFQKYYENFRLIVSKDKADSDDIKNTQETVKNSMAESFNLLTKVNKDEEMINLMKFQAAYSANAKIITTVDQMLDTLLSIKR